MMLKKGLLLFEYAIPLMQDYTRQIPCEPSEYKPFHLWMCLCKSAFVHSLS